MDDRHTTNYPVTMFTLAYSYWLPLSGLCLDVWHWVNRGHGVWSGSLCHPPTPCGSIATCGAPNPLGQQLKLPVLCLTTCSLTMSTYRIDTLSTIKNLIEKKHQHYINYIFPVVLQWDVYVFLFTARSAEAEPSWLCQRACCGGF